MDIPFIGGAYEGLSKDANPQRTRNLYYVPAIGGGDPFLTGTPGLKLQINLSGGITTSGDHGVTVDGSRNTGVIRGMHVVGDYLYVVCGNCVVKLSSAFNSTLYSAASAGATLLFLAGDLTKLVSQYDRVGIVQDDETVYWARVMQVPSRFGITSTTINILASGAEYYDIDSAAAKGNACYFFRVINPSIMATSTGFVTMADNGTELMICDGVNGYVYNTTTGAWTQLTEDDHNFFGGGSVTFQDGYLLYHQPSSNSFYFSSINNALSYDPLDETVAQAKSGDIVRLFSDHRELFVFKKYSVERFYNAAQTDITFARTVGGDISVGCAAAGSVVSLNNTIFWLALDSNGGLTVQMIDGASSKVISPPAICERIEGYSCVDDAIAFGYMIDGQAFYQITFPTASETWLFDVSTAMWFERTSYRDELSKDGRHRANCFVHFNDKNLVGDYSNGNLYALDPDIFTDNGEKIVRQRVAQTVSGGQVVKIAVIELICETGVALTSGQGSDPKVMLRVSKDGGHTWRPERQGSIGKVGEYGHRVRFKRFGRAEQLTVEVKQTDPVKCVWRGMKIKVGE